MIYEEQPNDFNPKIEVVGCFLEHEGEFLILQRQDHKPQGGTWGLPSGKVEKDESLLNAIIRETKEETGFDLIDKEVNYFKKFIVRYDDYDFIYHIFYLKIDSKPEVILEENGHKGFKWVKPEISLSDYNLIQDFDECIKQFYGIK